MDGNLATTSFEQLGNNLAERRATGTLRMSHGNDEVRVSWRDGVVVGARGTTLDSRLGDRLVHSRLLSRDDLTRALALQSGTDKPLGALLIEEGLVNEHVVKVFVQEQILDALFWPLRWPNGDFTFAEEDVASHKPAADMTFQQLVYALESRHRTWDEVTHTIPTTSAVPEFVPGADPSMASLEAGENAVLAAVDGRRSMETIADDLGFSTYEVGVILHGLAVLGLIRLQQTDERATEPSASEAPDAPVLTPPPAATETPSTPRAEDSDVEEPEAFVLSTDEEPSAATGSVADTVAPAAPEPEAEPEPGPETVTKDFFGGGGGRPDVLSGPVDEPAAAPTPEPPSSEPAVQAPAQPASAAATPEVDEFFDPNAEVDDDLEVWTMDIGTDDDQPAAPAQRSSDPTPIAAPVTPTPTPQATEPTPEPEPRRDPEPEPEPADEPAAAPPKPSGGDVSDLLRELRQLSDD